MKSNGVEYDSDIENALAWLCSLVPVNNDFTSRLVKSQRDYILESQKKENFGKDFPVGTYGSDLVACFFSQAKSLLDNRRAYEITTASHIIPWVKQLGLITSFLNNIPGSKDRAKRMLDTHTVHPASALFELIIAGNYAAVGFDVEFIPEEKGRAKTPDFKMRKQGGEFFYVECKRLSKGQYAIAEQNSHRQHIDKVIEEIYLSKLNLWINIIYKSEVENVPEDYLLNHLEKRSDNLYEWDDEHGSGFIKPVNINTIKADILINGSLLFNTKLARLIKGSPLSDENYNIYGQGTADERDPRFVKRIKNASLITWKCVSEESFTARSRHVTSVLKDIDDQLEKFGKGAAHIAIDVDVQADVADLRRDKNNQAINAFKCKSQLIRVNTHYLVTRVDENSSWMIDETVVELLRYHPRHNLIPLVQILPNATLFDNGLPGWKQKQ